MTCIIKVYNTFVADCNFCLSSYVLIKIEGGLEIFSKPGV